MADLSNRLPGRMLLVWVAQALADHAPCDLCGGAELAIAQRMVFAPPPLSPEIPLAQAAEAMLETWLAEQQAGRFRASGLVPVGPRCLAQLAAQHLQYDVVASFVKLLATTPFPERLIGALAVEPGSEGRTYPMVLGVPGSRSLGDLFLLLNAPHGTLDAGEDLISLGD